MSRYARFVCVSCRIELWLGKAIFKSDSEQPTCFQIGSPKNGTPLNSENTILNKVLWKMLADHARHSICVFVEGDPGYDELGDYAEIGGENLDKDISFEEYLKGWTG